MNCRYEAEAAQGSANICILDISIARVDITWEVVSGTFRKVFNSRSGVEKAWSLTILRIQDGGDHNCSREFLMRRVVAVFYGSDLS